jgi:hypothetical protein
MSNDEKEMLRRAALEMLALRQGTAHALPAVRRRVALGLDFKFSDDDLAAALDFHIQLGHVTYTFDGNGATKWFKATPDGILAVERAS